MSDTPKSLPVATRLFVAAVSVCGLVVVGHSGLVLVRSTLPVAWTLFGVLTIASGMLTVKVPSIETRFSISEAFAFASVLLFGTHVGVVILALDGVRISFRWKMNAQQTVFNFATLGLSMWAAGSVFFFMSRMSPLFQGGPPSASIVLYLGLMTAAYFAVNSGLIATAVGTASGRSVGKVWKEHYWPLIPSFGAGASVSLLLVLAFREVQFTAIALILPLVVICYHMLRSSYGRLEDSKVHLAQLNRLLLSTVETLATAIDAKDEVTHDHVRRVQQGTLALAREMGVDDPDTLKGLEAAALLHDTGKIAIPEHILNKPGRLTPQEFEKMKQHAPIGADILSSIEFPYPVVPVVRHHHENWDGTGYPDKLTGEAIPLGARILSVVDCYDALTSDRPYRKRMTEEQALEIIRERRGTMYDPLVVDTFERTYKSVMPPPEALPHPAVQAIGDARHMQREESRPEPAETGDVAVADGLLAVASLSRALAGDAQLADVGALLWMIFRQVVACDAMAIFLPDDNDHVVVRHAAGSHAQAMRGLSRPGGAGIAGWVAVNRRPAVNADPALDLGLLRASDGPALRSCLALPLMAGESLIGVLALYAEAQNAFSTDQARLLELLGPRLAASLVDAAIADEDSQLAPRSLTAGLKLVKSS